MTIDKELADKIIAQYVKSHPGRMALAKAMVQPLRTALGYRNVNGRCVPIDAKCVCERCGMYTEMEDEFDAHMRDQFECCVAFVLLT